MATAAEDKTDVIALTDWIRKKRHLQKGWEMLLFLFPSQFVYIFRKIHSVAYVGRKGLFMHLLKKNKVYFQRKKYGTSKDNLSGDLCTKCAVDKVEVASSCVDGVLKLWGAQALGLVEPTWAPHVCPPSLYLLNGFVIWLFLSLKSSACKRRCSALWNPADSFRVSGEEYFSNHSWWERVRSNERILGREGC